MVLIALRSEDSDNVSDCNMQLSCLFVDQLLDLNVDNPINH